MEPRFQRDAVEQEQEQSRVEPRMWAEFPQALEKRRIKPVVGKDWLGRSGISYPYEFRLT